MAPSLELDAQNNRNITGILPRRVRRNHALEAEHESFQQTCLLGRRYQSHLGTDNSYTIQKKGDPRPHMADEEPGETPFGELEGELILYRN